MLRDISSNCLYDNGASEKNNKDQGDETDEELVENPQTEE